MAMLIINWFKICTNAENHNLSMIPRTAHIAILPEFHVPKWWPHCPTFRCQPRFQTQNLGIYRIKIGIWWCVYTSGEFAYICHLSLHFPRFQGNRWPKFYQIKLQMHTLWVYVLGNELRYWHVCPWPWYLGHTDIINGGELVKWQSIAHRMGVYTS